MKRFLLSSLLLCFFSVSYGLKFTVDGITYTTLDDNSVKVTGFKFSLVDVVIPSEVTYNSVKYMVKEIDEKGLNGYNASATTKYSKMESLVISEGIEKIGKSAVSSNINLESVSLPCSLKEIGESAFSALKSLKEVKFPNGSTLQTISNGAFKSCKVLETISFYPDDIVSANEIPTFPESLESIGTNAFNSVPAFKKLIIHGNIKTITGYSFANCPNLEYLWLQDGISNVGEYAFYDCYALKYIVLPSTISKVGDGGFTCEWKDKKNTRIINRIYILLGDIPFYYSPRVQTDFYDRWLPANIDAIEGDCFYVKESAIDKYRNEWKKGFSPDVFDYRIPFNSDLTYSTNYREFDMDFHVAASKGNKPFVATSYNDKSVTFTSIDDYIVPTETGIVIRKTSDTDTWFQIAEEQGKTLSMNNYLKGVTYSDIISPTTDDGNVNFVLYNGVFCRFSNAGKLGDHKAYLQLPPQTAESSLSFIFSDILNGITEIKNDNANDYYFDLNGIRIEQPKKGLYIKNGKKIIF